uniref:Putative secreted protein n=1 Tax=Ixodes ricinus TaxID=34613 RepID=A0A6B0UZ28_IXORI
MHSLWKRSHMASFFFVSFFRMVWLMVLRNWFLSASSLGLFNSSLPGCSPDSGLGPLLFSGDAKMLLPPDEEEFESVPCFFFFFRDDMKSAHCMPLYLESCSSQNSDGLRVLRTSSSPPRHSDLALLALSNSRSKDQVFFPFLLESSETARHCVEPSISSRLFLCVSTLL